jgi:hypothetical protein
MRSIISYPDNSVAWFIFSPATALLTDVNPTGNNGILADTVNHPVYVWLKNAPAEGTIIWVVDHNRNSANNNITIKRGTNTIEGVASDMTISTDGQAVMLVYSDGDWKITVNSDSGNSPIVGTKTHGYLVGGGGPSNVIQKFAFGSANNASDFGDLSVARNDNAGAQSSDDGYKIGGNNGSHLNTIDEFSFGGANNASDFGDLSVARSTGTGHSSSIDGYCSGGNTGSVSDVIDEFAFGTATNALDFGDLNIGRKNCAGASSSTAGYVIGGNTSTTGRVEIDKFSFGTANDASDFGDLNVGVLQVCGVASSDDAYACGGSISASSAITRNDIQKFSFGTSNDASDFGDLTVARNRAGGNSSTTDGHISGGVADASLLSDVIDKFAFGTSNDASDFGDLISTISSCAGIDGTA